MPTLDKLAPEQRAIIELILRQRQSYDDLSGMLGMRASRVRELAREALQGLTPTSARRVEPQWRGQLADYLLGQQSGPESSATRGHLRRSEAARAWALSLEDSLHDLFADGAAPPIPGADREERRPSRLLPSRERRDRGGPAVEERPRAEPARPARPLSPAAAAAVRRRRLLAAAVAGFVAIGLIAFLVLRGDDDEGGGEQRAGARPAAQAQVVAQAILRPVGGDSRQPRGVAVVARQEGRLQLVVQAQLEPTGEGEAYETWLYRSPTDAVSLGGRPTDRQGRYQGTAALPNDFGNYDFLDISRERIDDDAEHSGQSVLRGRFEQPTPGAGAGAAPGAAPGQAPPQPPQAPEP